MDLGLESTTIMVAIRHIRRKGFVPSEDNLLEVIANPRNSMEVYWATIALRHFGTVKSIPAIKELTGYPKQDVKVTSVHLIGKIAGAGETQFYCDLLASTTYKEKGSVMWVIADVADDTAVPAVIAYFEKNKARISRKKLVNYACSNGAIYLLRVSSRQPKAKTYLETHIGLLLDNTSQVELRGWNLVRGRPKNEWVEVLFALADRPLPTWMTQ